MWLCYAFQHAPFLTFESDVYITGLFLHARIKCHHRHSLCHVFYVFHWLWKFFDKWPHFVLMQTTLSHKVWVEMSLLIGQSSTCICPHKFIRWHLRPLFYYFRNITFTCISYLYIVLNCLPLTMHLQELWKTNHIYYTHVYIVHIHVPVVFSVL